MQIFLARIVIAYNRSKILRVLLSYDRDFFFVFLILHNFFFSFFFFLNIAHFNLDKHGM